MISVKPKKSEALYKKITKNSMIDYVTHRGTNRTGVHIMGDILYIHHWPLLFTWLNFNTGFKSAKWHPLPLIQRCVKTLGPDQHCIRLRLVGPSHLLNQWRVVVNRKSYVKNLSKLTYHLYKYSWTHHQREQNNITVFYIVWYYGFCGYSFWDIIVLHVFGDIQLRERNEQL